MRRTLFASALLLMVGCSEGGRSTRISAGGATFINPIMQKWAGEYRKNKGVEIDYVAKGSGYGIEQFIAKTIDFGCSDAPMKKEQVAAARQNGGEVVHIPLIMGAVAVVYNLGDASDQKLKLSGEILADIYQKKIERWSDDRIAQLNPGASLPDRNIIVVARAESSGTTNIFSEYLAKASESFRSEIGVSTKPKWPKGVVPQEQNDGVAGFVKNNADTIGYVELVFAKKNNLPIAQLRNRTGSWVAPNPDAVAAAAQQATLTPPSAEPYSLHELTYSLTDAAGPDSYPICGISYAVLYARLPKAKGPAIVEFLSWIVNDGQQFANEMDYAAVPPQLRKKAEDRLRQITFE